MDIVAEGLIMDIDMECSGDIHRNSCSLLESEVGIYLYWCILFIIMYAGLITTDRREGCIISCKDDGIFAQVSYSFNGDTLLVPVSLYLTTQDPLFQQL